MSWELQVNCSQRVINCKSEAWVLSVCRQNELWTLLSIYSNTDNLWPQLSDVQYKGTVQTFLLPTQHWYAEVKLPHHKEVGWNHQFFSVSNEENFIQIFCYFETICIGLISEEISQNIYFLSFSFTFVDTAMTIFCVIPVNFREIIPVFLHS